MFSCQAFHLFKHRQMNLRQLDNGKMGLTCKLSAAFKKLSRAFCDTCTSPLYINSSNAAIFSADVASRITHTEPVASDGVSNKSAKFFEHAASISLWALKICPGRIRSEFKNKTRQTYCKFRFFREEKHNNKNTFSRGGLENFVEIYNRNDISNPHWMKK